MAKKNNEANIIMTKSEFEAAIARAASLAAVESALKGIKTPEIQPVIVRPKAPVAPPVIVAKKENKKAKKGKGRKEKPADTAAYETAKKASLYAESKGFSAKDCARDPV
jgi:hypothetical protein